MRPSSELRGTILHCIPGMGGGGAERQLTYLAREQISSGWDTHVVLGHGGPNLDRLHASGAHVHMLSGRGNHDPRLFVQISRLVRRVRPDIVQTWITQMDILGGLAALGARTPWVFTERSSEMAYPPTWKHRVRGFLANRASAIVSNSQGGDDYWSTRAPAHLPRFVISNAVPLAEIAQVSPATSTETNVPDGVPVILFVGRFSAEKNLDGLIAALRSILKHTNAVAVFCGDGPQRAGIVESAHRALPPGRARFPGYVSDVWRWLKRADVMVSLGHFEGNPNAVIEAMACGCPLVVSDIPAHRELLDDGTALFADPNRLDSMVSAVNAALSNCVAARERAGRARAFVTRLDTPVIATAYERVYAQLLGRPVPMARREAVA